MATSRKTTSALTAAVALSLTALTPAAAQAADTSSGSSRAATTSNTNAAANTVWTLNYGTTATTYVAKMQQSSTTNGKTVSKYNLETSELSSDLQLGEFKTPVKIGGVQLAIATIAQEPVGPAVGKVDPKTHEITQTQKTYLHIKDISPLGKGLINLAGKSCRTSAPVTMTVKGQLGGLFDPITLKGSYTIPNFANCGLITDLVNKQVAGPNNTIQLNLKPQ